MSTGSISYELCEIFQNKSFIEHLETTDFECVAC